MLKKWLCIALFCLFAWFQSQSMTQESEVEEMPVEIVIHVEGMVEKTLVFDQEPTVQMVIDELGVGHEAALECLNMTVVLSHEDHLYIQKKQEGLISLNKASKVELMEIKGIGEKRAEAIIAARPFSRLEDLLNVKGIGEKSYQNYRPYLCL